jgi:hypothetical protein
VTNKPLSPHTESNAVLIDLSDEVGGNQLDKSKPRTLASLRALVRERIKVYGAPLPDGFVLPDGITLDMLLNDDPKPNS